MNIAGIFGVFLIVISCVSMDEHRTDEDRIGLQDFKDAFPDRDEGDYCGEYTYEFTGNDQSYAPPEQQGTIPTARDGKD